MKLLLSVLALTFFASPSFASDKVKMNFHVQINFTADASNPNQFNTDSMDLNIHVKGKMQGESIDQSQALHSDASASTVKSILLGDQEITQIAKDGTQSVLSVRTSGNKIRFSAGAMVEAVGDGAKGKVSASDVECVKSASAMTCTFDATMSMSD